MTLIYPILAEGQVLAPAVWYNTRFFDHFFYGPEIRTNAFTPPTGEGFGREFVVSAIKLCSICLETCRKGYDGIGGDALDGHPLDVQQLDLWIRFLNGSGVLNELENVVSTEMLLYGEEGFGAGIHDLGESFT